MAKKITTDSGATAPREMSPEQHAHFSGIATNLIENSVAVGHGHGVGSQGPKGHKMVANDMHKQQGSYIPQGALQNRQNQFSDAGSADADDASTSDYGVVDKNG
jgi:hypothetical protein